ncbi:MAG: hypothetical protein BWY81_00900 [Firmicutes bacterium ADurb.Bin467]|nr:MAG: hypothetical protein BWY81_00900 [Firmicutes bacterium ADurb.Bin467]
MSPSTAEAIHWSTRWLNSLTAIASTAGAASTTSRCSRLSRKLTTDEYENQPRIGGTSTSACSTFAANTPHASASTPYCFENAAAAIITAMLNGKPVSCAEMYFSRAFRRLAIAIEAMLNVRVSIMMRASLAVSWTFSGGKSA